MKRRLRVQQRDDKWKLKAVAWSRTPIMSTLASTTKESEWDSRKKRRDVCEFMAFNDRISKSQCVPILIHCNDSFLLTSGSSECTSSSKGSKGGNIEHRFDRRAQLLTHARCSWHWASAPKRSKDNLGDGKKAMLARGWRGSAGNMIWNYCDPN